MFFIIFKRYYQYDNFQIISMFCEELLKGEIIYSIIIKKFKR